MKTKEELAEEYSELLRRFSAFDPKDALKDGLGNKMFGLGISLKSA